MASSELFFDMVDRLVKYGQLPTDYDVTTSFVNFMTRLGYAYIQTGNSGSGMLYVNQAMQFLGLSGTSSYSEAMMQMYVSNNYQVDTLPHYCNLVRLQYDEPIGYFSNIGAINTYFIQGLTLWQNGESGYANSFNIMHRYATGRTGSLTDVSIPLSLLTSDNIREYYDLMMVIINQVVVDCEQVLTGYPTNFDNYYIDDLSEENGYVYNSPQQTAIIKNRPSVLEVVNLHANICYLYAWLYELCSDYGYLIPNYSTVFDKITTHLYAIEDVVGVAYAISIIPQIYSAIEFVLSTIYNQQP